MNKKNLIGIVFIILMVTSGPLSLPLVYALNTTITIPEDTVSFPTINEPSVTLSASKQQGTSPTPIKFTCNVENEKQAKGVLLYKWDFDGDNLSDLTTQTNQATHVYETKRNKQINATVTVGFNDGTYKSSTIPITIQPVNQQEWISIREIGQNKLAIKTNGTIIIYDENNWLPLTFTETNTKLTLTKNTNTNPKTTLLTYPTSTGTLNLTINYGIMGKATLEFQEYLPTGAPASALERKVTIPENIKKGDLSFKVTSNTPTIKETYNPYYENFDYPLGTLGLSLSFLTTIYGTPKTTLVTDNGPVFGEIGGHNPWFDQGVTPYGEYFEHNQEYVSMHTGFLTITSTDISLPGRGMDLSINRVYAPPVVYEDDEPANTVDYSYQDYPWAPMGNGWMLGFPWIELDGNNPAYIRFPGGQRYEWNGSSTTGKPYHTGDRFTLVGHTNGNYTLYTVDGTRYDFDSNYKPTRITDKNKNTITFSYSNDLIQSITDTLNRSIIFSYNANDRVANITSGNRVVEYIYEAGVQNGYRLTSVTDPMDRVTSYDYQSDYLINQTLYPTGGSTQYTYSIFEDEGYTKYRVSSQSKYPNTIPVDAQTVQLDSVKNIRYIDELIEYGEVTGTNNVGSSVDINSTDIECVEYAIGINLYEMVGYLEWNISRLPDNIEVKEIDLIYDCISLEDDNTCVITDITNQPSKSNVTSLFTDIESGSDYGNSDFPVAGNYQEVELDNDAIADLESQLTANWFAVGLFTNNPYYDIVKFDCGVSAEPEASLRVEYMEPVYVPYDEDASYTVFSFNSTFESINCTTIYNSAQNTTRKTTTIDYSMNGDFIQTVYNGTINDARLYMENTNVDNELTRRRVTVEHYPGTSIKSHNKTMWYDNWGNNYYQKDRLNHESFTSYSNTNSANQFNKSSGTQETGFSDSFYTNTIKSQIHNRPLGSAYFMDGTGSPPIETYYKYDTTPNLVESKSLLDGSWVTTARRYDTYGNPVRHTDALGNKAYFEYNSTYNNGYLTKSFQELEQATGDVNITSHFGYNLSTGDLFYSIDGKGNRTSYSYDILGRILSITYPAVDGVRCSKQAEYNDTENSVSTFNENNEKVKNQYDGLGRLVYSERYNGLTAYSRESYEYNWQNQVTKTTLPSLDNYTSVYDALGYQYRSINPEGSSRKSVKDYLYNTITSYDEENRKTEYLYDWNNRLIEVREFNDTECYYATFYGYDKSGNLVNVTNGAHYKPANYTETFYSLADAYVSQSQPDTNYPTGKMIIREGSSKTRAFVFFNTSSIPLRSSVIYANFSLYCETVYSSSIDTRVQRITEPWGEYNVTYNTMPSTSTADQTTVTVDTGNDNAVVDWVVTGIVQNWADNPEQMYGFMVYPSSTGSDYYRCFDRTIYPTPTLEVKYSAYTRYGNQRSTLYTYDQLGRLNRTDYPDSTYETYTYDNVGNMVSKLDQNGNTTYYVYDSLNRLVNTTYNSNHLGPAGFDSRKQITLTETAGQTLTNYPIQLTLHYGSGTDIGNEIYLASGCQTDFGDIRFTASDGYTSLDYWIQEKTDSTSATIWVEIPTIIASTTTTFYIYYDSIDTVNTTSNGDNTFLFFDDFSGTSLDSQWSDTSGTPTVANGYVTLSNDPDRIRASGDSWLYDIQMHGRVQYTSGANVGRHGLSNSAVSSNFYSDDAAYVNPPGANSVKSTTVNEGSYTQTDLYGTYPTSTWTNYHVKWTDGEVLYKYHSGSEDTQTVNVPNEALSPRLEGNSVNSLLVDWVFVGKYVDSEPTVTSTGFVETGPYSGTVSELYKYDNVGNLLNNTGNSVTTGYQYDARNRVVEETFDVAGDVYSVGYSYDNSSRVDSLVYPDSSTVEYLFDGLGRVDDVTGYAEFTYNVNDLVTSIDYENGVETSYTYDNMNRPTNILVSGVGGSGSWLSGYDQRIEFSVESDRFTGDLTSPVRLVLSTSAGIDSTDVSAVFDELGSSYKKLAVTSSDAETEVGEVEVSRWDSVNEEAELWFRATIDADADSTFYLYYDSGHADNANVKDPGAATTIWPTSSNENYIAVYHMGESTGNLTDSTGNSYDASVASVESRQVDGYNGGYAVSFEPTDYLTLGDLNLEGDELTVFVVANAEADKAASGTWVGCFPSIDQYILYVKHDAAGDYVRALIYPTNGALQTLATDAADLSYGEWAVWCNTYDRGTSAKIYKDGTVEASITPPDYAIRAPSPSNFQVSVGALDTDGDGWDDTNYWDGQIDSIIIAQTAFSDDQIDVITSGFEDDLIHLGSEETSSGGGGGSSGPWLSGWDQRIGFTVESDRFTGDLTSPIRLVLSTGAGISNDDISAVFDELGSSYKKLAVTSSDAETEVGQVEVARWDSVNEEAELWFRAPIDGDTDTQFYLYYDSSHSDNTNVKDPGDATNLWPTSSNEDYIAVYHMGESTGDLIDSTGNNNDATVAALESRQVDGYSGGYAVSFDAADYLTLGDLDLEGDELSVLVASYVDSDQPGNGVMVGCFPTRNQYILYVKQDPGGDYVRTIVYNNNTNQIYLNTDPSDLTLDEWAVWATTYDRGSSYKIYKDGVVEASTGIANYALGTPIAADMPVSVGAIDTDDDGYFDDSNYFDGMIDSIVIARSVFNQSQIDVFTSGFEDDLVEWGSVETPSSSSVLLNLTYSYDKTGSVTQIIESVNDYNETYSYDLLDRLNQTSGSWNTTTFGYDAVGNRLIKAVSGGSTTTYAYDSMDRLSDATGMEFAWDSNGNLLDRYDGVNAWNYTYDSLNMLKTVTKDDVLSAVYTYDAGGRRVRSWDTGDGTVDYVYRGLNIIDEVDGGVHEKHVFAGGMHIASNTNDTLEYYHVDHLGSTRLKTAENGSAVYESNYEPFGPSSGESGSEDYRYTGKHEDPSGLYYFGARYYDPLTGRFTTRDTVFGDLTDPQSQNRYVYCMNNPHKYVDPNGKDPKIILFPLDAHNAGVYEAARYGNLYPEDVEGQWNHYKNEAKADLYGSIAGYGAFAVATIASGGNLLVGAGAYALTKRYAKGWIKTEMSQNSYDINEKGYTHLNERPKDYGLVDMIPDTILGGVSAISPFRPTDPIGSSINKYIGKINSDVLDYLMNLERDYDYDSYSYDSNSDGPLE